MAKISNKKDKLLTFAKKNTPTCTYRPIDYIYCLRPYVKIKQRLHSTHALIGLIHQSFAFLLLKSTVFPSKTEKTLYHIIIISYLCAELIIEKTLTLIHKE